MSCDAAEMELTHGERVGQTCRSYTNLFTAARVTLIHQVKADNQSKNIPT